MRKKLLVVLLVMLLLVVSSGAEEITFETLIHNDIWWKTEQGQSKTVYCVFNLDGTGITNGSPFMWERTIFGIEITNAPESVAVSGRYNLIEKDGVPGLQRADSHGIVYIRSADLATALNLTPSPTPAAKAEDNIIPGIKDMVLLERNQVKIYFTGNYLDTNSLGVEIIIENNSDYDIVLGYTGQVNGWSIHNSSMGTTVKSHSKAKGYLFFDPKEIDATTAKDIESADLKLIVKNAAAKQKVIFEAETGYMDFKGGNTVSKAASEEPPVREYALGETVSTDMMEFVLSGFDCVYYLHPKSYAEKDDMAGGAVGPGADMTFANPEDYDALHEGDKLALSGIEAGMCSGSISLQNETTGSRGGSGRIPGCSRQSAQTETLEIRHGIAGFERRRRFFHFIEKSRK